MKISAVGLLKYFWLQAIYRFIKLVSKSLNCFFILKLGFADLTAFKSFVHFSFICSHFAVITYWITRRKWISRQGTHKKVVGHFSLLIITTAKVSKNVNLNNCSIPLRIDLGLVPHNFTTNIISLWIFWPRCLAVCN